MAIAPGIYNTGTATVASGGLTVSFQGVPNLQAAIRPGDRFGGHVGFGIRISAVGTDTVTLAHPWPGAAQTAAPYEIVFTPYDLSYREEFSEIIRRYGRGALPAMAELIGSAGAVPVFTGPQTMALLTPQDLTQGARYDVQVAALIDRAAYDNREEGFAVLVGNVGDGRAAIYSRVGAAGNWSAPAYITGPAITLDITEVDEVPYGTPPEVTLTPKAGGYDLAFELPRGMIIEPGTTTTFAPGQPAAVTFVPIAGGYRLDIALPKGETGDNGGLTRYWQERVTSDTTAAQAQAGLGGTAVGRALFTAADAASARNTADVYSKAEAGALSEMRNKIINPLFAINQRGVTGTVTLTAGKYGHDRFKAGASGFTYTFATSNGVTTITITAGSLILTIEAAAFAGASGTYVLSWTGTAQGRINTAAYGASGRSAMVTGSANVNVEWSAGTLSRPQFELEYSSRFTPCQIQQEYALYQRYFQICTILPGAYYNTTVATVAAILPVQMRVTPTVTLLPGAKLLGPGIANRDILGASGALTSGIGGQVDVTTAAITNIKPVCFVRDNSLSFDAEL